MGTDPNGGIMNNNLIYNYRDLFKLSAQLLCKTGVSRKNAVIAAKVLIQADLEGVSSHGVTRLPIYLERLQKGYIKKKPEMKFSSYFPAVSMLDADNGLGHIAAYKAMKKAIVDAKNLGVAAIGVKNSNHFGTASYYANMALRQNLVGIVISNGPPAIPPWGGGNPILVLIPLPFLFREGMDMVPYPLTWLLAWLPEAK